MAWTKEIGPDGLPLWRGKDSIVDMAYGQSAHSRGVLFGCAVIPMIFFYACLGSAIGAAPFIPFFLLFGESVWLSLIAGPVALIFGVIFTIKKMKGKAPKSERWIGQEWSLNAARNALTFKGAESWSAPLDAVARVETARTAEYTPSRQYQGLWSATEINSVSDHEWQTFLFLNDGTRRVIYHANAARDDCAALAASIREYVESARAGAAPSIPSTPDAAGGSAPRAAGFDL